MSNWRKLLGEELKKQGETEKDIIQGSCSLSDIDYDFRFTDEAFTYWTKDRVYFPVCYDNYRWVGSVPRNPCDERTQMVGGW